MWGYPVLLLFLIVSMIFPLGPSTISKNPRNEVRISTAARQTVDVPEEGYPKLKGRAADIYGLAPAMWELFTQHMDADDPQHKLIQLFLKLNITPHNVLEEFHPRASFLAIPSEQSGPLYTYGLQMAQLHVQLSNFFLPMTGVYSI